MTKTASSLSTKGDRDQTISLKPTPAPTIKRAAFFLKGQLTHYTQTKRVLRNTNITMTHTTGFLSRPRILIPRSSVRSDTNTIKKEKRSRKLTATVTEPSNQSPITPTKTDFSFARRRYIRRLRRTHTLLSPTIVTKLLLRFIHTISTAT